MLTDCSQCGAEAARCTSFTPATAHIQPTKQPPVIILLAYHKTGTVWWEQTFLWNQSAHLHVQWILEPFAPQYNLPSNIDVVAIGNPSMQVMQVVLNELETHGRTWRAVLMTRDPRDSIVSGLHYHKWYGVGLDWCGIVTTVQPATVQPATVQRV